MNRSHKVFALAALSVFTVACAGKENAGSNDQTTSSSAAEGGASGGGPVVKPTGDTVAVELHSDEKGNYFKPAKFEVHRGDVIRFVLKSGVHNVHFLPDSNPGKANLPPASDMLQLPDQTLDIPVNLESGHYYFQCDPHAALGMTGRVEVEH